MTPATSSATNQRVAISYSTPHLQPGDQIGLDDEWEVEGSAETHTPTGSPLDYEIDLEPEEVSPCSVTSESSPVAPQSRASAQPPPLPPRKRLSSGWTRRTPPPPPRRTMEVVTIEVAPAQDQATAAAHPQPQPTTLPAPSDLPPRRARMPLVTWLLAGVALFGMSSAATAFYQLRVERTAEAGFAAAPGHQTRPATPLEAAQGAAQPPRCLPFAPTTRSEPVANSNQVASAKTVAATAAPRAAVTRRLARVPKVAAPPSRRQ